MAVIPSAYNALMGMFSTRQPQNVSGSIYDIARADAQKQMLAQIGGGLMAAAVPQTATMRAQALQAALGNMGNIGTNVYNAAQARLMAQRAEQEQRQMAAMDKFFSQGTQTIPGQRGVSVAGEVKPINMPDKVVAPGGIPVDRWNQITEIAKFAPDTATSMFAAAVKGGGTSGNGFSGSKALQWVSDSAGNYFQTYVDQKVDENGNLVSVPLRPPGAVGDIRFATPAEIAGQKSEAAAAGQLQGKATANAANAIDQAELSIQNIDDILNSDVIDTAVGPIIGAIEPKNVSGIALNLKTGGKFGSAVARLSQLDFASFAEGVKLFQGMGSLSNAEGEIARGLKARLQRTQDPEEYKAALKEFRQLLIVGRDRARLLNQTNPETNKKYTSAEAQAAIPLNLGGQPTQGQAPSGPASSDLKSKYGLE